MELPEPEPLLRMNTTMSPNQSIEKTCAPHMICRLFIKNIFNLPGMLNDECNTFLDTYEFKQIDELGADVTSEDVSLKTLVKHCKNAESVHKVVMYLYIYFLIIEEYPTICSNGVIDKDIPDIIHFVRNQINAKKIPKKVEQYNSIIHFVLEERGQINVNVVVEDMIGKQRLSSKFVRHIKTQHEYVGCLMYSDKTNHATIVGRLGCNTATDGMLTIKDSHGVSNTCIPIKDFLNRGYEGYELRYFVYLFSTYGGKTKRKKNKSYRKFR
jgi:hypothetical protein